MLRLRVRRESLLGETRSNLRLVKLFRSRVKRFHNQGNGADTRGFSNQIPSTILGDMGWKGNGFAGSPKGFRPRKREKGSTEENVASTLESPRLLDG